MPERTFTPNIAENPAPAYDIRLEIAEYKGLLQLEGTIPPEEYAQHLLTWRQEKIANQETNLGERFNSQMFEARYPVRNNRIQNPFRDEAALDFIITGQQHRLGDKLLSHDRKRELAEVISFSAVESFFLANPQTSDTLIIPSPEGGSYGKNYIDVFDLQQDGEAQFARLRRFPTNLSAAEHLQAAQKISGGAIREEVSPKEIDIRIKSLVLRTSLSAEQIMAIYTPDKQTTSLEKYQGLLTAARPWINNYVSSIENGESEVKIQQAHNAVLNFSDIYMNKAQDSTRQVTQQRIYSPEEVRFFAPVLGTQDVREVITYCGKQGSKGYQDLVYSSLFDSIQNSLFTAGEDEYGTLKIHCEECGSTYQRTAGKLEKNCRKCGGTKGISC